jgi:hypothetical protein
MWKTVLQDLKIMSVSNKPSIWEAKEKQVVEMDQLTEEQT